MPMNYKTQATYKPVYFSLSDSNSITEPDQAFGLREILYRFVSGTLPPLATYDKYPQEGDESVSNETYDLSDIPTRYENNNNVIPSTGPTSSGSVNNVEDVNPLDDTNESSD